MINPIGTVLAYRQSWITVVEPVFDPWLNPPSENRMVVP